MTLICKYAKMSILIPETSVDLNRLIIRYRSPSERRVRQINLYKQSDVNFISVPFAFAVDALNMKEKIWFEKYWYFKGELKEYQKFNNRRLESLYNDGYMNFTMMYGSGRKIQLLSLISIIGGNTIIICDSFMDKREWEEQINIFADPNYVKVIYKNKLKTSNVDKADILVLDCSIFHIIDNLLDIKTTYCISMYDSRDDLEKELVEFFTGKQIVLEPYNGHDEFYN